MKRGIEMAKERSDHADAAGTKVTLPVSDTVPAPGNYTVRVLNMSGGETPVVNATDLVNNMGSGTAKDEASALLAPEPGRNTANNAENQDNGKR